MNGSGSVRAALGRFITARSRQCHLCARRLASAYHRAAMFLTGTTLSTGARSGPGNPDKDPHPNPEHMFLGREICRMESRVTRAEYENRCVLVSGAGGSIGSELSRQILACRPSRLILYELSETALFKIMTDLQSLADATGIELVAVLGSVADEIRVGHALRIHHVQIILHAAAYKHVGLVEANPLAGLENNVFGTQALARQAIKHGVERFILISSDKAVRPAGVMGASKRLAEILVQDLGTRNRDTTFAIVRFGNILGSSGSVVPLFQDQVRRGGPVLVTDRRATRYFMTVQEAAQLVMIAGANARGNDILVLDMGRAVPIYLLARKVIEHAGYSVRDSSNPKGDIAIRFIGLRKGEKLRETLSLSGQLMPTHHPRILRAEEAIPSEIEVAQMLQRLRQTITTMDEAAAIQAIAMCIDGFGRSGEEARRIS
ncbi:polysaccharide biosynthesis protein [bacterium]|nr:polysaccharide biosynthesis protein [bacterium]